MAQHLETGKKGEKIARDWLEQKGFIILEQNWRCGKAEVDIIARNHQELIFVEVKTRSGNYFGNPEVFVTAQKEDLMARAASAYMEKIGYAGWIRFDIISVLVKDGLVSMQHFEDAFFPGLR